MKNDTHIDFNSEDTSGISNIEGLQEGVALGTWSTTSTATTASCPISSAASVMTANCAG